MSRRLTRKDFRPRELSWDLIAKRRRRFQITRPILSSDAIARSNFQRRLKLKFIATRLNSTKKKSSRSFARKIRNFRLMRSGAATASGARPCGKCESCQRFQRAVCMKSIVTDFFVQKARVSWTGTPAAFFIERNGLERIRARSFSGTLLREDRALGRLGRSFGA